MKRKSLTGWFKRHQKVKKNIHEQIAETIAERNRVLPEWERLFADNQSAAEKDIHVQLKETISAFKKAMKQHERFFMTGENKKAA